MIGLKAALTKSRFHGAVSSALMFFAPSKEIEMHNKLRAVADLLESVEIALTRAGIDIQSATQATNEFARDVEFFPVTLYWMFLHPADALHGHEIIVGLMTKNEKTWIKLTREVSETHWRLDLDLISSDSGSRSVDKLSYQLLQRYRADDPGHNPEIPHPQAMDIV
ncbi:hypothetical protein IH979_01270, partial [Patescibacteria group bacterium]|nr:hypothetical protein [Patescibacteria group bacterium]